MDLFTLHNCCVKKLKIDFQSRLTIPQFSLYTLHLIKKARYLSLVQNAEFVLKCCLVCYVLI